MADKPTPPKSVGGKTTRGVANDSAIRKPAPRPSNPQPTKGK